MTLSFVCTLKRFSCQVGITFSCVTTSSLLETLVLYEKICFGAGLGFVPKFRFTWMEIRF